MHVQKNASALEIDSRPESINIIEKLIDDLRAEHNIHEDAYGNILVAVTEAVNNAIQHGNKYDPNRKVKIGYELDDDTDRKSVV